MKPAVVVQELRLLLLQTLADGLLLCAQAGNFPLKLASGLRGGDNA